MSDSIPVAANNVSVAWRDRPFDGAYHRHNIPFRGKVPTVAEILDVLPGLPDHFRDLGEVRFNGDLVDKGHWHRVRPKQGISLTLHLPLKGGGGGGQAGGKTKNPLATIATIGVLVAALAVSGGAAAGLIGAGATGLGAGIFGGAAIGGLFGAGTYGAAALAIGVSVGGALLVSALFPPPTTAANTAQTAAPSPSGKGPASLQGNVLSPGSAVPRVLGTMRVFPPFLTPQLVELRSGGVEYAETVLGLAGPHALSALWVDGVDITAIPEANIEIQNGLNASSIQTLVQRQGFTLEPNLTLSRHLFDQNVLPASQIYLDPSKPVDIAVPQYHRFVTRNAPDELWIHLNFPGGLVLTGASSSLAVPFRLQIRLAGTSTWTNLPELHYQRYPNQLAGFKTEIRLKWRTSPSVQTVSANYNGATGWIYAYDTVPGQTAVGPTTSGWQADPYFYAGSGDTYLSSLILPSHGSGTSGVINVDLTNDNAIIYLDPAVFTPGTYEFQIIRGMAYVQTHFTQGSYAYDNGTANIVWDLFGYYLNAGTGRNAIPGDQLGISQDSQVERIVSVWNQNPIQSADFATISMVVYNRQLSNISVLASGYTYDWDGTGWNTIATTSNPAPHYRDVLGGYLCANPLPAEIIDDASLVTWRAACISQGYTVNAVIEGKTSIDVLTMIAGCGYARPASSETWGVIRDYDRSGESPVQIFTPRNMNSFNWTKAFPKLPSGFRITYQDASLSYVQNDTTYYVDSINQDANNLETISYDGLVTLAQVNKRAAYDLQTAISRMTFYNGTADLEAIVCKRGDLVGVQSDILALVAGFARIRSVITANGLVTGLRLEGTTALAGDTNIFASPSLFTEPNVFLLGGATGIAIRLKGGGGQIVKQITATSSTESDTISFTTPFADPGTSVLDIDCLCTIGSLGSEFRRLIVYGMVPKSDLTTQMVFVDEAPELWPPKLGTTGGAFVSTDDGMALIGMADQTVISSSAPLSMVTDNSVDLATEDGTVIITG